ncbi:hypothetical protein NC653_015624 [Populus alba x Populus x berolinensis]|uniref:Uncharacterized protein n=1 Tax=Populus alba x Populus x berolinensis TaxID=444605 RepID=A0AAD6QKZ0_9ROSI|nr:hypothetical protein NC653_015624 [Populus alba x Populus x berolinensis]
MTVGEWDPMRFKSDQWCALLVIFNIAARSKILGTSVKQCPALPAPERPVSEATETQNKYASDLIALATASAAEAAVAAAHPAAEDVRLTGASQSFSFYFTKWRETLAAIKIQSAFRANLFWHYCELIKAVKLIGPQKKHSELRDLGIKWDLKQARKALRAQKGLWYSFNPLFVDEL